MIVPISAILAVILGACSTQSSVQQQGNTANTDAETSAARAEIEAATGDLSRWLSTSNVDSAASRLTDDYRWLPPDAPEDSGRANWVRVFTGMMAAGKISEQNTMESLVASGPIAVSRGRIIATFTPGAGAPKGAKASVDTAKYLWLWRRVNGRWLLATAAWNADSPRR
jgi:ketosteroid isomerase-like protein